MKRAYGAGSVTSLRGKFSARTSATEGREYLGLYATKEDAWNAIRARSSLVPINSVAGRDGKDIMHVRVQCACGTIQEEYVDADAKVREAMGAISCMFCGAIGQCKMVGGL